MTPRAPVGHVGARSDQGRPRRIDEAAGQGGAYSAPRGPAMPHGWQDDPREREIAQAQPGAYAHGPAIDRRHARSARRHSVFVAIMKGLLPSLAVCIILVFVIYSQGGFDPDLPDGFAFDPGAVDVTGSGIRMVSPKLTGLDAENQRFEVNARSAVQDTDNPGRVTLDTIRGRMQLKDGGWVQVDADGGIFDSNESMLSLDDNIEVTMSSGYVARLNGAEIDFETGRVDTTNPVLVFMNAGIITGNRMTIYDKGKRVEFTNGASMTINGRPGEREAGQ